jgi:hypothetical protein
VGARTYFGPNDSWRLQAYTAYGTKDQKFKYGISGKWMFDKANRFIISAGNRKDIEQIGASLTTSNDVLSRGFGSSGLLTLGSNGKLTKVNLTNLEFEIEPVKNLTFRTGFTYKTLESASTVFSLDYYTDLSQTTIKSKVNQSEINAQVDFTPNRKPIGFAVERYNADSPYSRVFINYSLGIKGMLKSDFDYKKIQLYYKQPFIIGPLGRSNVIVEVGKIYGTIPLGLMGIIPGNQSVFNMENAFSNLKYYEFVADQYVSIKWDHNFQGRFFSRIPIMRKLNWREIIGIKGVYGTVSEANRTINASGLIYIAPEDPYWEYSVGIGNIFKFIRIDCSWRGNYRNVSGSNNFAVNASLGFYF